MAIYIIYQRFTHRHTLSLKCYVHRQGPSQLVISTSYYQAQSRLH